MKFDPETVTLEELADVAWQELVRAVDAPAHGFHWPVFGTVDAAGRPQARVVVLRRVDRRTAEFAFHTDRRSPKIAEVLANPVVALTFHDSGTRLQLRIGGRAAVETDTGLVDAAWQSVGLGSRRCYLAPAAPSTVAAAPSPNLPLDLRGRLPDAERVAAGRGNFAVVRCCVDRIDMLCVQHAGHVRAAFEFADGVQVGAHWLEP
ncbi:MAG: pyridoxamine 5'-phosphate oxidase family protein [bacterium]|nr:pyridoxamine 5'-phosphate oxidase family protein [bacterium]